MLLLKGEEQIVMNGNEIKWGKGENSEMLEKLDIQVEKDGLINWARREILALYQINRNSIRIPQDNFEKTIYS